MIGAGPAGLMAALTAGRAGARVILADEDFRMGGRLNAERLEVGGTAGRRLGRRTRSPNSRALPNVRLMPRTTVIGAYDGGTYGALERVSDHLGVAARGRAARRLLAHRRRAARSSPPARIERPIAFPDNDRPGVMLAGAVRAYVAPLGGGARAHRGLHQQRRRLAHRASTSPPRASRSRR